MSASRRPMLQMAVDTTNLQTAQDLVEATYPHFDIVEAGTPLIIEVGLEAVRVLKERWPDKLCLADLKIMDGGRIEAASAFRRGADIVTVLALADDETIRGALAAAGEYGGDVMVDLINVPDVAARAREVQSLGVPIVCLHTAYDTHGSTDPLAHLAAVREAVDCRIALAGGLGMGHVAEALGHGADILVFGGTITRHPQPGRVAAALMAKIEECA